MTWESSEVYVSYMFEAGRTGKGDVRPLHQNIRFTRPVRDSSGLATAVLTAARAKASWDITRIVNSWLNLRAGKDSE